MCISYSDAQTNTHCVFVICMYMYMVLSGIMHPVKFIECLRILRQIITELQQQNEDLNLFKGRFSEGQEVEKISVYSVNSADSEEVAGKLHSTFLQHMEQQNGYMYATKSVSYMHHAYNIIYNLMKPGISYF